MTEGPPSMVLTTWRSQIFSNNVFGIAYILCNSRGGLIGFCQLVEVFFHDFFLGIGDMQEAFVKGVDIVAVKFVAYLFKAEGQGAAPAAGRKHDSGLSCTYFVGIYDLVGGSVFKE